MNKIFRRIFNAVRGAIVAVEETKSSNSQSNAKGETIIGGGMRCSWLSCFFPGVYQSRLR